MNLGGHGSVRINKALSTVSVDQKKLDICPFNLKES